MLLLALAVAGCSPKRMGMNRMADALAATAGTYRWDNDIELVRAAAPSTLKLVEMMLEQSPEHAGLLSTACSGFAQYAYGFLQLDSEIAEPSTPAAAAELKVRAGRMYERAKGYCIRTIETRHRGFRAELAKDATTALARTSGEDVAALFWLGVAWGGELEVSDNSLMRLPELVSVRRVLNRALELDEAWERGAIHEALIVFDGMPVLLGGSVERATKHFERAVALSEGQSAFAYVTMASRVSLPIRDRQAFDRHLKAALAIDVNRDLTVRLANLLAQKRARFLISRTSALFSSSR